MKTSIKTTSMGIAWFICILGMVFYSYEYLLRITPSVMEPSIREFFDINAAAFGTLVGLYYMAYTPMQLVVGSLLDLYGARRILAFATAVCAIGSLMFCSSHSIVIAGIGRFLVGFGSAFAFVGALKLAAVWLPPNRFALFAGLVMTLGMIGGIAGDMGLTKLVQAIGWKQTIFYSGILGLILTPIMAIFIRDREPATPQEKIRLGVLLREYLKIIRNANIWVSGLIACLLYLALSAFAELWGIPYLRGAFGFTAEQAAAANMMVFVGWLVGAPMGGWISDRLKNRRIPLFVGSIGAAISIAAVLYLPHLNLISVAILLLIFGIFTSAEVICFAVGHDTVPRPFAGTAVAFINMLTMLGGFIFQPFIGKLLDWVWSGQMANGIRVYSTHDYRVALTALPIAMLVSMLFCLVLRESNVGQHESIKE